MQIKVLLDLEGNVKSNTLLTDSDDFTLPNDIRFSDYDRIVYSDIVYELQYVRSNYNTPIGYHTLYYYLVELDDYEIKLNLNEYID